MNRQFIVSAHSKEGKFLTGQVWDSSEPMALGYPFRWVIETSESGIRVRNLQDLTCQDITERDISTGQSIFSDGIELRILPSRAADIELDWKSNYTPPDIVSLPDETRLFKKSIVITLIALLLFFCIAVAVPLLFKPKEEALIPPQFAKIIFTPPSNSKLENKSRANPNEPTGSRSANLVQAFKSETLQKTTRSLMKGGLLSLLSQSNFTPGKNAKAASAIFDQGTKTQTLAPDPTLTGAKPLTVATLGGGADQKNGDGVGYGKGEHASLSGQGNSYVSLSTPDSTVEEGLSKDEVGKVIHSHISEVRYCYESAMLKNPAIQGKLIVEFTIQRLGNVKSAKINSSTLADPSLDQCIVSHLLKWKFPKTKGGIDVSVSYPFIFKSLGR